MTLADVRALRDAAHREMSRNVVHGGAPYHAAAAWWWAADIVLARLRRCADTVSFDSLEHHLRLAEVRRAP